MSAPESSAAESTGAPPGSREELARIVTVLAEAMLRGTSPGHALDLITTQAARAFGVSAAELGASDGKFLRVFASAGEGSWNVVRTVDMAQALPSRLTGDEVAERFPAQLMTDPGRGLVQAAGYAWTTLSAVPGRAGATYVLAVYTRQDAPPPTDEQRWLLRMLCTLAAAVASTAPPEGPAAPIAVISHEVRTPVAVIQGFADTVADRWDELSNEERRASVRIIQRRTHRLGALLDRMAEGSRPEQESTLTLHEVDLCAIVRDAVRGLAPVEVELPGEPVPVRGDEVALASILDELLGNAAKFSPDGATIGVRVTPLDAGDVLLEVLDRGIGVHEADRERVFLRFWQAQPRRTGHDGGVGIGLFLVRRLVEAHGGTVTVRPRPGGGTTVVVRLIRSTDAPIG